MQDRFSNVQLLSIMLAFLGGIFIPIAVCFINNFLLKSRDKKNQQNKILFDIYMQLLELNGLYFFIAASEINNNPVTTETKTKIFNLAWQIADNIRLVDNFSQMETILYLLLSNKYKSAIIRHDEMGKVIDQLGSIINPRYSKVISNIFKENMETIGELISKKSKVPGQLL